LCWLSIAWGFWFVLLSFVSYSLLTVLRVSLKASSLIVLGWGLALVITLGVQFLVYFGPRFGMHRVLEKLLLQIRGMPRYMRVSLSTLSFLSPIIFLYLTHFAQKSRAYALLLIFSRPLSERQPLIDASILVVLVPAVVAAALTWPFKKPKAYLARGMLIMVALATLAVSITWLSRVTPYPFSLDWDEGNRLYDYSQFFGSDVYLHDGPIDFAYSSPGRYILWGIAFLINGLPIWAHRLWDAIVRIVPAYLVGWLLFRHEKRRLLRVGLAAAGGIFIHQARVYPMLLLAAALVLAFQDSVYPFRAGSTILAASYATISRWTWAFAPASWGGISDMLINYRGRAGHWLKRLLPAVVIFFLGALPGLVLQGRHFFGFLVSTSGEGGGYEVTQPLLWYRLLPNETYPEGIVLGLLIAVGPILAVLAWLIIRRIWDLDVWQILGTGSFLIAFLAIGLVASVKIGGGSDLHNLDMFMVTVVLVVAIAYRQLRASDRFKWLEWPTWVQMMVGLTLLMATWNVLRVTGISSFPNQEAAMRKLGRIEQEVAAASEKGDVLFMDQRQLLTFRYIKGVPLVAEYEKKYLMDMAMADNSEYFRAFYEDLQQRRFELIISHPLKVRYEGRTDTFGLEGDAWVKWVSAPVLCYYEPELTLQEPKVMLLVPREEAGDCSSAMPAEALPN
jgi:hypothetical protein